MTFSGNEVLNVKLQRHLETVDLVSELASSLNSVTVKPGVNAVTLSALLCEKDNKYQLKVHIFC